MFGKFKRNMDFSQGPRGPQDRRMTMADFGFDGVEAPPLKPQALATYDRLGQTMVGTPLNQSLTGPDAAALAAELCDRIYLACHEPGEDGQPPKTGVRHVVLDLQNVQYMDSMCVGVLVELLTMLKEAGGNIALVNASGNIEYLFKLTRLDRVFPICRDVLKAIEVVEREG
jgi:ABC-type transporter Mla MlaB component